MAPPRKCNCNAPGCLRCYRREWGRAYRKKAYGTYQRHGNLDQVRAHIETLRDSGISLEALAEAIGGSRVNLQRIAAGKTARISRQLADRILAAEPRPKSYPGWMVQRRLRAAASDRARTWQAVREHGRSTDGRWHHRGIPEVWRGAGRVAVKVRADQDGITVPPRMAGAFDVLFDGEPVWSFTVDGSQRFRGHLVRWPRALRRWLDGYADITLREVGPAGDAAPRVIDLGRVRFGSGEGQIRLVDDQGRPVVIDKWGIMQRPFASRGSEVTKQLGERTREVIEILREDCGIDAWLAFGTLLGAARAGKAIGHDSDSDLLYLSEKATPAEINREIYDIQRAFARRGLATTLKSGSFVTVLFPGPDGAPIGIDVYACFYIDGVLHETATLREPIPREAILPLSTIEFEGLELPAPADPARLLAASYGPGWRVPDPSFRHEPDRGTTARFEGWFGNMMTARRGWEAWWNHHRELRPASELAERVLVDHPEPVSVLEVGAGNGSDAVALGEHGHRVNAFDFARHSFGAANRRMREDGLPLHFGVSNLYDLRDVMTLGALQVRRPRPPRVFFARFVLGSFHPRGREAFWRLMGMVLRQGGRAYLEFTDEPDPERNDPQRLYPLRFQVDPEDVRCRVEQAGGRVVLADRAIRPAPDLGRDRPSWHLVAEWAAR